MLKFSSHFILKIPPVADSASFRALLQKGNLFFGYILHEATEFILPKLAPATRLQLDQIATSPRLTDASLTVAVTIGFAAYALSQSHPELEWKLLLDPDILACAQDIMNGTQIDMTTINRRLPSLAPMVKVSAPLHYRLCARFLLNPHVDPRQIAVNSYAVLEHPAVSVHHWDELAYQYLDSLAQLI